MILKMYISITFISSGLMEVWLSPAVPCWPSQVTVHYCAEIVKTFQALGLFVDQIMCTLDRK